MSTNANDSVKRCLASVARSADRQGEEDTRRNAAREWYRRATAAERRRAPRYLRGGEF